MTRAAVKSRWNDCGRRSARPARLALRVHLQPVGEFCDSQDGDAELISKGLEVTITADQCVGTAGIIENQEDGVILVAKVRLASMSPRK